ncbi:tetratricopeptide repeat protein [Thermodesulfobacteriota bacterium]
MDNQPPPSSADLQTLFSEGFAHHQSGNFPEAERLYRLVLARMPDNVNLLCNLGILYRDMKQPALALTHLQQASAIDPENPMINLNLGAIYEAQNDLSAAVTTYRRALQAAPSDPRILSNLGKALYLQGEQDAALDSLNKAVMLAPDYPPAQNNLGVLLCGLGRAHEAITCFKQSLSVNPEDSDTLYNLAGALNTVGDMTEAESCYRRTLVIDPHHASAHHMLAAVTGTATEKAPIDYVADTFDRYADQFDYQLTEKLGYQVPVLLKEALEQAVGTKPFRHGLDLGCGTGLSGLAFRDLAEKLTGVDLSAKMLEKAGAKKIYQTLHQADVVTYLTDCRDTFDLFIATDVFVYIGDLVPVFTAIRERAATPACLVFSIERAPQGQDYELRASGRYAQSVDYILRLAADFGYTVVVNREQNIRQEQGQWIEGNLFILSLP